MKFNAGNLYKVTKPGHTFYNYFGLHSVSFMIEPNIDIEIAIGSVIMFVEFATYKEMDQTKWMKMLYDNKFGEVWACESLLESLELFSE